MKLTVTDNFILKTGLIFVGYPVFFGEKCERSIGPEVELMGTTPYYDQYIACWNHKIRIIKLAEI